MHDAVGDEDDAGEPVGRHVGERVRQRREEPRAVVALPVAGLDEARLDVGHAGEAALQLGADAVRHRRAVAERLRGRAVDDDRDDVLHPLAVLLHQRRIGERHQHERERDGAHDRHRPARDDREHDEQQHDGAEIHSAIAGMSGEKLSVSNVSCPYCPSRSSRAGTWTWSAL